MVLGVQQGFELEMLAWQWLYQHIPYTWPPARPGTSQAWPPASPHSYARSWPLGQGLGKVFFGGDGVGMLPVFDFPQHFLTSPCEAGAVLPPQPGTHPTAHTTA